ncbi:MAG: hypothetical protein ACEY3L_05245 [Wolbachia sp.]
MDDKKGATWMTPHWWPKLQRSYSCGYRGGMTYGNLSWVKL